MIWKPSLNELEVIAEYGHAGMSADKIAAAVGVTLEVFTLWFERLAAGRAVDLEALYAPPPMPIMARGRELPVRIAADRLFEKA